MIKIYKSCDASGYTYDQRHLLAEGQTCATQDATASHATSEQLIENIQGHPHKLYMDVFLSPGLFNDLTTKKSIVVGQMGQTEMKRHRVLLTACWFLA
jgi:hypothetical protein